MVPVESSLGRDAESWPTVPIACSKSTPTCLAGTDVEPYFPYAPRPPHRWDDDERCWVDQDEKLSVLILGGSSYIVGTDFFANRVE